MKKILITIIAMLMPMLASADQSGSCGVNLTWTYFESTKTLTISGMGVMTNYSQKSSAPWTSFGSSIRNIIIEPEVYIIGDYAFRDCSSLTSVTISSSVTSIGRYTFSGCRGLTSITIPKSVSSIGNSAFSGCSGLTSITVEEGNMCYDSRNNCNAIIDKSSNILVAGCNNTIIPNSVTSIGGSAFEGCSSLTSITIPNSVTSIGGSAFYGCSGLTSITIPNSVTSIGESAFQSCSGLISITIPNSVTSIGSSAFNGCSGLTSITIPNSVTSIGNSAFNGCSGLTSITIPNSVTSIGNSAFSDCSGLSSIIVNNGNTKYDSRDNCNAIIEKSSNTLVAGCKNTIIPNSVTSIGRYAFHGCSGLTSITIPNSVFYIGGLAFYGCSGLASITIGKNVRDIGEDMQETAFVQCSSLASIIVEEGNAKYDSRDNCNAIINTEYNTLITGCKGTIIPNNVTKIEGGSFLGSGLTSITIPNSVTSIGVMAFYECTGLTSITIPNSVNSIGFQAFYGCRGLSNITIGNMVSRIGEKAFSECVEIKVVNCLAEKLSSSYNGGQGLYTNPTVFEGSNIENAALHVPSSAINDYKGTAPWSGFGGFVSLSDEDIPKTVLSDDVYYSYGSENRTITITGEGPMGSFDNIEDYPWYPIRNDIINLVIEPGVTSIAPNAFNGCTGLTSLAIPDGVTSIGAGAFDGCTGLISVTIPSSVTSVGAGAFDGCTSLTSVNISDLAAWCNIVFGDKSANPLTYAHHLFLNGEEIKDLVIPNGVTSIGDFVFSGCSALTSVIIPSSVTSIGAGAFDGCTGLITIISLNTMPPTCILDKNGIYTQFTSVNKTNCILWVPKGSGNAYKKANGWKDFKIIRELIPGDANVDGVVNVADIVEVGNAVEGKPSERFLPYNADMDGNGIDASDVDAIVDGIMQK